MKKVMFTIGLSLLGMLSLIGISLGIYAYVQDLKYQDYLKY